MGPIEKTLRNALNRIDSPEKWNQGAYAVDAAGNKVAENSPGACKWCFVGAVCAEFPSNVVPESHKRVFNLMIDGMKFVSNVSLPATKMHVWNDSSERKYVDIVDAYNHGIAKAHSLGL